MVTLEADDTQWWKQPAAPLTGLKGRSVPTKRHRPSRPKASKARTDAQKLRRKELWLAREADRRTAAEARYLARYDELKHEMARHGQTIGQLSDVLTLTDAAHRFEVIKARVERWDALWSITLRKRDTRAKIIVGGAVLAELAYYDPADPTDREFRRRLVDLLDRRVPRIRDRLLIRNMLTAATMTEPAMPLRQGGQIGESLEAALEAIGEGFTSFDAQALAMSVADADLDHAVLHGGPGMHGDDDPFGPPTEAEMASDDEDDEVSLFDQDDAPEAP